MERRDHNVSNDVYNASEWGHTLLWFCILLLTACVVASGGVVSGGDIPVEPNNTTGTYSNGRLTLVLSGAAAGQLSGVAKMNGKDFPVKATVKDGRIEGTFASAGNVFAFTATINENQMKFSTGQTVHELIRQTPVPAPVPNPLEAVSPAPSSGTPGEGGGGGSTERISISKQNEPVASPLSSPVDSLPQRPMLRVQQGQFFRWSMPQGWHSSETTNGVDIAAPDGRAGACSVLLVGAAGSTTPALFVEGFLPQCGMRNLKFIASKDLPDQTYAGSPMKVRQMELTYDINGTPFHGLITCAVINGWNQYTAFMQGAGAVPEQWEQMKTWLPAIAAGVVITNPRQVALQDQIVLPKNRPLDDSSIMSGWEAKNRSEDRISQKRSEATLGYERMKDTSTGQMYDMPYERYDATKGGYINPQRPTEILEHAE